MPAETEGSGVIPAALAAALAPRYEIEHEVGRGGMSVVYSAQDTKHDRRVAVKVLRPELSQAVAADRFLQEVRVAAKLQHPNILPLFDSGSVGDDLYYVMPYVEGQSLRDLIRQNGALVADRSIDITIQIAHALHHAHTEGVVHRDVKPENILLSDGHAFLTDFGIAHALTAAEEGTRLTETGVAIGTPHYMSPEQGTAERRIDGRSDVYSLGCVLYEMLVGEPPFTGPTAQAIIARHVQERIPSIEVVRPVLPSGTEQVVHRALNKMPADRFQTAEDFATALAAVRSGTYVVDEAQGIPARWRNLALLLGVLVVVVITGLLWTQRPAQTVLDTNRLVVFPLTERGVQPGLYGAGDQVGLMILTEFEHVEPIRAYDGWKFLDPEQRADLRNVPDSVLAAIARARSARYILDGWVLGEGDSASVTLRLFDVAMDSVLTRETAAGNLRNTTAAELGRDAARPLLLGWLAPERDIAASPFEGRDVGAMTVWLQGESFYRQSRFDSALALFERAVEIDSALAVAALKGAQAASWLSRLPAARNLARLATAHLQGLSPRYASMARGMEHYLSGAADSAVLEFKAAIDDDPEWSEAWMGLAETYYHLLPGLDALDSLAEDGFRRASDADAGFSPPIVHLAEIAVRQSRLDSAEDLIEQLQAVGANEVIVDRLGMMVGCVRARPQEPFWVEAVQRNSAGALQAARSLSVAGAHPECAQAGFEAILAAEGLPVARKWSAFLGLQGVLVARGADSRARAIIDSVANQFSVAKALFVIDAIAGGAFRLEAQDAISRYRQEFGAHTSWPDAAQLWFAAIWHTEIADFETVAEIERVLLARADSTGDTRDRWFAEVVGAHGTAASGDLAAAVTKLESLQPIGSRTSIAWGLWESLAVERMRLLKAYAQLGDAANVLRVGRVFDYPQPVMYLPFLSESLRLRLEAAEAIGRARLTRNLRQRLGRLTELAIAVSLSHSLQEVES